MSGATQNSSRVSWAEASLKVKPCLMLACVQTREEPDALVTALTSSSRSATDFQQVPWLLILTFEQDSISLLNGHLLFGPNAVWPWK